MSHNRWQFPGRMQPVLSIPRVENIKLDQWEPRVAQPTPKRRSLPTAILAGALFFVPLLTTAPPVFAGLTEPVRREAAPQQTGFTVIDPTALNRPIVQYVPLVEPVLKKPALLQVGVTAIDPIALDLPEPAQVDKWGQPLQTPPRARARPLDAGLTEFSPLPIPLTLVPGIDSWEPRLELPARDRAPLTAEGSSTIDPSALMVPGPASLDKWHSALAEPIRLKRQAALSEEFAPIVTATVPRLDSWEARTYGPATARQTLPREGLTVVDPDALTTPEPTQLDKWYQALSEPRRDLNRWQWLYPVAASDQLFNVPEPADVRMICASISVAPRIAGEPSLGPRITGALDMDPRIQGTPRLVDCE